MRLDDPRVPIPQEIVASCDCGAGLRPAHDWYECPECGEDAKLEV